MNIPTRKVNGTLFKYKCKIPRAYKPSVDSRSFQKKNAMNTSFYESIVVLISKESVMSWINIFYLMC